MHSQNYLYAVWVRHPHVELLFIDPERRQQAAFQLLGQGCPVRSWRGCGGRALVDSGLLPAETAGVSVGVPVGAEAGSEGPPPQAVRASETTHAIRAAQPRIRLLPRGCPLSPLSDPLLPFPNDYDGDDPLSTPFRHSGGGRNPELRVIPRLIKNTWNRY